MNDKPRKFNIHKGYKKNNVYTKNLFKIDMKEDDFFKSSSEDLSNSISFRKEIKHSKDKEKIEDKKIEDKNILILNKKLKGKLMNSKASTSFSNKKKKMSEDSIDQNQKFKFEETGKDDNLEDSIIGNDKFQNDKNNNLENEKNSSKNHSNKSNNFEKNSNKRYSDSNNINSSNENSFNKDDEKNSNNKNIFNNFESSSFSDSDKKSSNSKNFKIDTSFNKSNKSSKNNINKSDNDKIEESYSQSRKSSNKNQKVIKFTNSNLININKKNKNIKNRIKFDPYNSKKITTTTRTNLHILETEQRNININKINRFKKYRKLSHEFSMNSSISLNDTDNKINTIKNFIIKKLLNIYVLIIMLFLNIFSLISNDIKHIWLPKNVDIYFDTINIISILYFIGEIISLHFLNEFYLNSFNFWKDIIATLCILLDIELITNKIFVNNFKTNNSSEYIYICIIILSRVIRATKVIRCFKLYNLNQTIKRLQRIYSQKQQRDLINEELHKKKLINKIHTLEEGDDDIEESALSNESNHITKNSTNVHEANEDEYIEEIQNIRKNPRRRATMTDINLRQFNNLEGEEDIKRNQTSKKINRSLFKRRTFKLMRKTTLDKKKKIESEKKINELNLDGEGKKEEEKDVNKKTEKEISMKIDEALKNTKITNKVKNAIALKIIVFYIVIAIICILLNDAVFSINQKKEDLTALSYIYDLLIKYPNKDIDATNYKIKDLLSSINEKDFPLINITKNDILLYENNNLTKTNFRNCELIKISYSSVDNDNSNEIITIIYSKKRENNQKHYFQFILTLILCIFILFTFILFGNDLTNILLNPFEVMIEVAENVSKDPMNAKNIEELKQEIILMLQKNKKINSDIIVNEEDIHKEYNKCYNSYEVKIIMNAIIKISALLAMSVGEAGGEIIHKNISSTNGLHFHSRGKKKFAIFGFCNIRNFEEINIVLQEEVIPLINQIAEIVHTSVDQFRGNTNKNIGDSFFNVWKFYNNINIKNKLDKKYNKDNLLDIDPTNPQVNITADCSLLAYLRCLLKINKNLNILNYRNNKKLDSIIPNFKINMGFGLHLGYGIEGPVGSVFKMEASYLSPNVNIAARLETATKQFGVNILISGKLYNLFTDDMKSVCRYVDCVTVKGSSEPIDLYTIDINYDITPQKKEKIKIIQTHEEKEKILKEKKMMIESLIEEYGSISPIILEKKSYWELIDEKSEIFYDAWENAMRLYKKGEWHEAKKYFEECLKEDAEDGPSNTLYNYIKQFNFKSPANWKGQRELLNK